MRARSEAGLRGLSFLEGGDMGELMRAHDWSTSPLGEPASWAQSLRSVVGLLLSSKFPMFVAWGDGLGLLYNEGYAELLGAKHPQALGCRFKDVWADIWPEISPLVDAALAGEATYRENLPLRLNRTGLDEQAWFTFSYSPVRDEAGHVAGMFCTVAETTGQVLAERDLRDSEARLRFLDRLGAEAAPLVDADAVLATTTRLLGEHLNLSVCAYADMDEDQDGFTIRGDWAAEGSNSIVGHYRLADFGELAVRNLSAGLPLVINDNLRELAPEEAATFQEIGIAATICMPLVKEGRLVALMAIHDRSPRAWTEAELGLLREVTARSWAHVERVGATADLRDSEARFRLTADAVPQIVWITDSEGRVEFFNKQWSEYTGAAYEPTTAAEVAASFVHPDDVTTTMSAFNEARCTGRMFLVEHRIRSAAGEYRWFLVRGEPHRTSGTGDISRWFGASVDIHDRKVAEAALRELNETLETQVAARSAERDRLWNLSQDMLARADYSGMMSAVSPAWTRVLGWSETELLTRGYASFMHPDDMAPTLEAVSAMAETGQPSRFENRIATNDGGWKHVEWTVAPEPGGLYFIAVGRDLSLAKAREAELEAAQEALRQSQKMEAMGQLTGGVAHDFNNLLTPIVGSLDMLVRKGLGNERERRLIDGALQSAERAKTLVQRLLAFARRQPLQPTAVDVTRLVRDLIGIVASTSGPKVDIRVELPDGLPPAMADANQLEMAVLNLAVNARDAMPEGGILSISAARETVRPGKSSALRPGQYIRLSVSDTGVGMDHATLARAVEPFFSTKGVGKGTGLGLSMVHGLALQLKGGLTIKSRPGEGTTIDLWLPVSPVLAASEAQAPSAGTVPRGLGTALLVDDEDLVRMSTADMLVELGYEVVEAGSAEEALRLVREGLAPNLLVTDHLMPGMSGAELARSLRVSRPSLPVLIVSGYSEAEGVAPDLPRLTKPFRNAELATSLAALMPPAATGQA
jgi:PAS domain S-box-containing protein